MAGSAWYALTMELTKQQFFAQADCTGQGCWLWRGVLQDGYGAVYNGKRYIGAHRIALSFYKKAPSAKAYCLHSCDNPPCVNPAHLRWGTHRENIADMLARGRQHRLPPMLGPAHPRAVLDEQQVLAVWRALVTTRLACADIARQYSIGVHVVRSIGARRRYASITNGLPGAMQMPRERSTIAATPIRGQGHYRATMNEEEAKRALALLATGLSVPDVARKVGKSRSAIAILSQGHTWRHLPRPGGLTHRQAVVLRRNTSFKKAADALLRGKEQFLAVCATEGLSPKVTMAQMRKWLKWDHKQGWHKGKA